jgi:glyoxylase-like metal-dependent hydrolase (beta-lactamase superfamily II)
MKDVIATALYEGTYSVGIDKKFNKIDRNDPPAKGALKLSINPFLIQDRDHTILFDVGIGDLLSEDATIDTILNNLSNYSIDEYDITDIFVSHLHFDHFAGLANRKNGYWDLTFPDATVWVSKEGWNDLTDTMEKLPDIYQELIHFLNMRAEIRFLESDPNPIPPVTVEKIGGHTEHHQALFYKNGEHRYLMAGDVLGRRIAINKNFLAKFDYNPQQSMDARNRLKELAYSDKYTIMAYHETDYPLFKLVDFVGKEGYTIENV